MEFQILPQQLHIIHDVRHISWTDCNDFFNFLILFFSWASFHTKLRSYYRIWRRPRRKAYRKADWKEIRKVLINSRLKAIYIMNQRKPFWEGKNSESCRAKKKSCWLYIDILKNGDRKIMRLPWITNRLAMRIIKGDSSVSSDK